jgi:two-component system, OmpR family, response regulator ResD
MKHGCSHILIVDDEPLVLKLFTTLLEQNGYTVTAVSSGEAAMEVLREEPVDLLVLDLSMPRTDGFDVLRSLRVQLPGLPILVISGFMQGALLQASELLGAAASLLKTEAPGLLVETVKALLRPESTASIGSTPQARRSIV